MNRRSFLQMVSAALAASTLGVRGLTQQPDAINWNLLTDWDVRYDLTSPWSVEGTIYATDTRKIIALPGEFSGKGDAKVPNVGKLPWNEFDAGGWQPLGRPVLERYGTDDETWTLCLQCFGIGRTGDVRRCDKCNGYLDVWYDDTAGTSRGGCHKCHEGWVGGVECLRCHGTRHETEGPPLSETIHGYPFCPAQMQMLRTLGELDIRVIDESELPLRKHGNSGGVLLFRGAGGVRGLLMGLRHV